MLDRRQATPRNDLLDVLLKSSMKSLTEGADCFVRLICSPVLCQVRAAAHSALDVTPRYE
jgi:hypothetical protein